jgi:hypothetical protein
MVGMDADHLGIVNTCLQEPRLPDDCVLSSVAVLHERLERLKHTHVAFAGLSFSPQVQQLSRHATVSVVG